MGKLNQVHDAAADVVLTASPEAQKTNFYAASKALQEYAFAGLQYVNGKALTPPKPAASPTSAPAPSNLPEKPTTWPFPGTAKYYQGLADKAAAAHAAGDMAALKAVATKPDDPSKSAWVASSQNGKLAKDYHAALVKDLEEKQAVQTMATVQAAQAKLDTPAPTPPKPAEKSPTAAAAMPNFAAYKMPATNTNAASNNPKIEQIEKLATAGDVKGLISLAYGTNTYGKKQAKLANDALKALGSEHSVTAGQKANTHPALTGGVPPAQVQTAAAVTGTKAPEPHPATSKPDLSKLDTAKATMPAKPHFDKSSKAWVNDSNNKLAAQIAGYFASGNLKALLELNYQVVDKETGVLQGTKPISEHPAKDLKAFYDGTVQVMREVAYPPKPLKVFQAEHIASIKAIDTAFPSKPFGTTIHQVKGNEKVGFWVALGKVDDVKPLTPGKTMPISSADATKAYADYKTAPKLAKTFINGIQQSGAYNDLFRDGKTHDHNGNKLSDVAEAALKYAQPKPAGTVITRWQHMTKDMVDKLNAAGPGLVIQATGSMCCSKSPTATKDFGAHRINVIYADGAKAVDSFGSGSYQGEQEVTTLPNARFVVLKVGKQTNGNADITLLMLPPDLGLIKQ